MRRRSAFTLVELLVVISILLILSTLVWAVFKPSNTDKMRSAARIAQSAFLGAKDRALHAKELRGVRLIRDTTDTTLVNGFVYLQPLPLQTTGNTTANPAMNNFALIRPNLPGNSDATRVVISGAQAQSWYQQDQNGVWPPTALQIRVPSQSGQWLNLLRAQNSPPYWGTMNGGNLQLTLQVPYQGGQPPPALNAINTFDATASCDIQLGNDVLPFHQPISLSSGIVIDLNYCSTNVRTLAGIGTGTLPYIDFMFSPRGGVTGYLSGLGPLHFLMRDLKDAADSTSNPLAVGPPGSANPDVTRGDRLILTVFPQTGLVQVFEIDPTDNLTNGTTAGPPDGLADNLFAFAQQGKAAGR